MLFNLQYITLAVNVNVNIKKMVFMLTLPWGLCWILDQVVEPNALYAQWRLATQFCDILVISLFHNRDVSTDHQPIEPSKGRLLLPRNN